MASIAITGAGGRLGRHFREDPEWLCRHELAAFSRTAGGSVRASESLCEPAALAGFDAVLHLAWSAVPKTAEENPDQAGRVDLPLLEKILESAAAAGQKRGRPVHFIFFSTGAVYGNALHDSGSVETDPPSPIGEYARGKLAAERLIGRFTEERELCATILRVSNAYGFPADPGRPQGVVPLFIQASLEGARFERWGGDSEKDYLHVDDLSRALLAVFDRRPEGLFNVASGRSHRLSEVLAAVERITGKPVPLETGGELPWDVTRNRISAGRFSETAGWKPEIGLEEGIARLVREMRKPGC